MLVAETTHTSPRTTAEAAEGLCELYLDINRCDRTHTRHNARARGVFGSELPHNAIAKARHSQRVQRPHAT